MLAALLGRKACWRAQGQCRAKSGRYYGCAEHVAVVMQILASAALLGGKANWLDSAVLILEGVVGVQSMWQW